MGGDGVARSDPQPPQLPRRRRGVVGEDPGGHDAALGGRVDQRGVRRVTGLAPGGVHELGHRAGNP
jgi:hypothetical protein